MAITIRKELLDFLINQRLMTIASAENGIWIANVYYGVDIDGKFYFISPISAKHSQQILKNPNIAFSIAWYNPRNHADRKAVQGLGICRLAKGEEEVKNGVQLHNKNFPEFASRITVDWIHNNEFGSSIWVVEPRYIKFWNDELYGKQETEEFHFSK